MKTRDDFFEKGHLPSDFEFLRAHLEIDMSDSDIDTLLKQAAHNCTTILQAHLAEAAKVWGDGRGRWVEYGMTTPWEQKCTALLIGIRKLEGKDE